MRFRNLLIAAVLGIVAAISTVALGAIVTTTDPAAAPNGTHYKSGSPTATCSVSGTTVTCNQYTLGGVGNINATETLTATYTATVVCRNNGGKLSDSQHQGSFSNTTGPTPLTSDKNGFLTVTSTSVSAPTESQFLAQQTCPNPGWTPEVSGGITLQKFTYTLNFAGFTGAYITITGP